MPSEKIELPPLPPLDTKMSIPYEYIRLIPGYAEVTVHELMTAYALLAVKQEREKAEQDAKFWRWWVGDPLRLEWAPGGEGQVRWVRWIDMPQPDISKLGMEEKGGGLEQLCAFLTENAKRARVGE